MITHKALYISNLDNKKALIDAIIYKGLFGDLSHLKGAFFSEITINKFIEEERTHGIYQVKTDKINSLQFASQGERKKALLQYIISKSPDYIVVDNLLGSLDVSFQQEIQSVFLKLSQTTLIIQIENRVGDFLPFIEHIYQIKNNSLVLLVNHTDNKFSNPFLESLPSSDYLDNQVYHPVIKFNNVSVSYGDRTILSHINWEIKQGEFWQLIGPNGSGKSTILSMIFGDNPKAFGQDITLFGVKKGSGESVWEIKRKIGYFSSEMLRGFKRLDSIGNMIVSGFFDTIGLYKQPTNQQIKSAQQWLHVLGLFEKRKESFLSLSKGHQSLVLIARAMVKHPPLLILDEPTNGLDDHDVKLFSQLINKIAKETNTTILYVSHRLEEGLLKPDFIYELTTSETGSTGKVLEH